MKLFQKIFLFMLIAFIVIVFSISYFIAEEQISCVEKNVEQKHKIIGSFLSKEIEVGYFESHWPFESLKKLSEYEGFLFWWIVRDDGIIHLADKASFMRTVAKDYFPEIGLMQEQVMSLNIDGNYGIFFKLLSTGKNKWSFWYGFSLDEISERKKEIIFLTASISISALLVVSIALFFGIKHLAKPIKTLTVSASIIGGGDLTHRVKIESQDELGDLAVSFNIMAADLLKSYTALLDSEEKYRQLSDLLPQVVFEADERGHLTFANRIAFDLFGYTIDDLSKGVNALQMLIPEDRDRARKNIQRVLNGEKFGSTEYTALRKDGRTFPILIYSNPIIREGESVGLRGIIADLTEVKRAQEALQESEERYRSLVENIDFGVTLIDAEHNIVMMNDAQGRLFKKPVSEFVGKKCFQEFEKRKAICPHCPGTRAMATGKPTEIETEGVRDDGTRFSARINAYPIFRRDGTASGFIEIVEDITEKKKIEDRLQQARKLEAIGTLAGGIAHDFNNLLSVIMGNIELAKDDIKAEDGISEYLKEAGKASLLAKELTKQLITFSKSGAPVKKIGPIGDLVKKSAYFTLLGSNVRCNFFISNDLWLVDFDVWQMTHAVKNLIVNAVEAMPDGGSIDVRAENFEISSETVKRSLQLSEGKYVKISIRDQGVGIPEKDLSKIFDPYFSTKEMGTQKGVGLGLATTYSIINRHDGHITVESEVGVGTTFTLYLPAYDKEVRELKPVEIHKTEKPTIRTGRILVMDDEELIRNLAKQILRRFGYDPELAKDGGEAIELYKRAMDSGRPYEVVILDLTVKEGMGGKETVKKLLEFDPQVKAIISSGYSTDPIMTAFRKYGFLGSLAKPYTMKDLSDALNKVTKE